MAQCKGEPGCFVLGAQESHLLTQIRGKCSRRHNFYPNFWGQVCILYTQAVLKIISHIDADSGNEERVLLLIRDSHAHFT